MISQLLSTLDDGRWQAENASVVFLVDPWLSRNDRFAITQAVEIARVPLLSIMEAPATAAYTYTIERRGRFEGSSTIVCFVDVGFSHAWAALFRFTDGATEADAPTVDELGVAWNSSLGAAQMDSRLTKLAWQRFRKHRQMSKDDFSRQMQNEVARARELSVDKKAALNFDHMGNDEDSPTLKVKRSTFEALIGNFNLSLNALFRAVLAKANITAGDVNSIELLGGASRVPFVQECLKKASGLQKLDRTLNSEDAIALGSVSGRLSGRSLPGVLASASGCLFGEQQPERNVHDRLQRSQFLGVRSGAQKTPDRFGQVRQLDAPGRYWQSEGRHPEFVGGSGAARDCRESGLS
jgi:molecular chaperone DnaK (HSP70)